VREGRFVEIDPGRPARRVVDLKGRWATPGWVRGMERFAGDEAAFLVLQRAWIPQGFTSLIARVDGAGLRALRSLELGRSLRLRVHAVLEDEDPARLAAFVATTPPATATGGFGTGGRLSSRAAGLDFAAGAAPITSLATAARSSGWQFVLFAEPGEAPAAREFLSRLGAPPDLLWRVETPEAPVSLESRTREASERDGLPGGVLAPGRPADLVLFETDPREGNPAPASVMMDGRTAFQSRPLL
jgi:hypothetical protein